MFHQLLDIHLSNIKKFDDVMNTNYLQEYKKIMWYALNEFEKPLMSAVFTNGRQWRKLKDQFLYVPEEGTKNDR